MSGEKLDAQVQHKIMHNVTSPLPSIQSCRSDSCDDGDLWCDDGFTDNGASDVLGSLDFDREWKRRQDQFHTIGYRDGLLSGKEKSAQVGFNLGFRQSVLVGHKWGLVRGVTSALAHLPDHLKEQMVVKQEARDVLRILCESVHSISTLDALRLFHEDIMGSETTATINPAIGDYCGSSQNNSLSSKKLGMFSRDLELLLQDLPQVTIQESMDKKTAQCT